MPHESSLIGAGERSGDRQVKQVKQVKQQACSQILELGLGTVLYTVYELSSIQLPSHRIHHMLRTTHPDHSGTFSILHSPAAIPLVRPSSLTLPRSSDIFRVAVAANLRQRTRMAPSGCMCSKVQVLGDRQGQQAAPFRKPHCADRHVTAQHRPEPQEAGMESAGFHVVAGTELHLNKQAAVVDRLLPLENISN